MFEEYCNDRLDTTIRKKGKYVQNYYESSFPSVAVCLEYYYVEIIRFNDSNTNFGRIQFIKQCELNRKGSMYSIEKNKNY